MKSKPDFIPTKALLLCAGKGTRLRPYSDILPKCLMPINGKPLLEYWLKLLTDAGIQEILINIHHHSQLICQYLERSPYKSKLTLVYEQEPLGTGGTLLANRSFFRNAEILMIHGDNLSDFDLKDFIKCHRNRPLETIATMMLFKTDVPQSCGIVRLDEVGVVTEFHEKVQKPPSNLANAAVYLAQPEILELLSSLQKTTIDFSTEVIPLLLGRLYSYNKARYHRDIGTIESLLKAQSEFAEVDSCASSSDSWEELLQDDSLKIPPEFISLLRNQ